MDGYRPLGVTSYEQMLIQKPDAVVIATPWETHIPFAIAAMKANIPVGCEVGGATSLDECWQLVRTYEETHTPCMLLENCCFGQDELMVLHMVRRGLFGSAVCAVLRGKTGRLAHPDGTSFHLPVLQAVAIRASGLVASASGWLTR